MRAEERNELALRWDSVPVALARRLFRSLPASAGVEWEDLVSVGRETTLRAIDGWDPTRSPLRFRIAFLVKKGLVDYLRLLDPLKRTQRRKVKQGKWPQVWVESWEWRELARLQVLPFLGGPAWVSPLVYRESELHRPTVERDYDVRRAVARLDPRRRDIVQRVYWGGELQTEIAAVYGLTPTRIGQLRQEALLRLRRELS